MGWVFAAITILHVPLFVLCAIGLRSDPSAWAAASFQIFGQMAICSVMTFLCGAQGATRFMERRIRKKKHVDIMREIDRIIGERQDGQ